MTEARLWRWGAELSGHHLVQIANNDGMTWMIGCGPDAEHLCLLSADRGLKSTERIYGLRRRN
jgi:hypothetical protein